MGNERATASPMSAGPTGGAQGRSLAGLIDVLDRADGPAAARRPQPGRSSARRTSASRSGAARTVPLRSVQPAPTARPQPTAPRPYVPPEPEPVPVTGLAGLVRRAALWGAGPRGEHLAWRAPVRTWTASPAPARSPAQPPAQRVVRRPGRVRTLLRRAALWGAGPRGEYLAWGGATARAPREVDPPVVLHELPSTPTIAPVASSPAAALLPRGPSERPRATGRPSPDSRSPAATGPVRTRGDPGSARSGVLPRRRGAPGPRARHGARSLEDR